MKLPDFAPFTADERGKLEACLAALSHDQTLWLSGFLARAGSASASAGAANAVAGPVLVIYGTESGNAEVLADRTRKALEARRMPATTRNMADLKTDDLAGHATVLVVVSTWGDGEPPDAAARFHGELMGDGAPRLEGTQFAVCALGDTSYEKFCQTGREIDARLEQLGARRLVDRQDCDVDFDAPFEAWLGRAIEAIAATAPLAETAPLAAGASAGPAAPPAPGTEFGKKNPFPAPLKERILLNGTGSAKETIHVELSLAGSGLTYAPGDALAVIPENAPSDVEAVLEAARLGGDEMVELKGLGTIALRDALARHLDITGLSRSVMQKYHALAGAASLANLLDEGNRDGFASYVHGRQIVDLLADYPVKGIGANDLAAIFRKLPPRLYSIASSLKAHPDEVHLTIAVVRYHTHGRSRTGVASSFCADRVPVGGTIPVYVHANKNFKLPDDPDTPIIMVGPGTGVAPFRAFIEERAAVGARGRNWLFFGDQHYTFDFLYQLEWQDYLQSGVLDRLDVAFSRDQPEKVYVQDRMRERAAELYRWLQDGAHFYVCGDASRMAGDVHSALLDIARTQGGMSDDNAADWLEQLKKERRYQRDVY